MINAVYAIMEQPELRLSDLYDIIIDLVKRERILANVKDEKGRKRKRKKG